MKKSLICLVFVFLVVGVLSVGNVWAGGASERPSPDEAKCKLNQGYEYLFNPVGCYCKTSGIDNFEASPLSLKWSRSNWQEGFLFSSDDDRADDGSRYYCYVNDPEIENPSITYKPGSASWGTGEVRMCTEDEYTEYYGVSTVPASSNGQEGNRECSTKMPYCKDKKCNECLEDGDCSAKAPSESTTDCIFAKYKDKNKLCTYCQHISGSGDYKVTLVINAPITKYSKLVEDLFSIEPLAYLNSKNKFTFQVVQAPLSEFCNLDYVESRHPTGKVLTYALSLNSIREILDFSRDVCKDSDITIFIDQDFPPNLLESTNGAVIPLEDQPGYSSCVYPFIHFAYYGDDINLKQGLQHELGHALGDLEDEYYLLRKPDTSSINIAPLDTSGQCAKFTNYGVSEPNCFLIQRVLNNNLQMKGGVRKSTSDSLMTCCSGTAIFKFNAISCAGLLNKMDGTDIKQGVKYCLGQEFAPDNYGNKNYNIGNGIMPQG